MDRVKRFRITSTSGGGYPCHSCRSRLQAGDLALIVESQHLVRSVICCSSSCAEQALYLEPGSLTIWNYSGALKCTREEHHDRG